MTVASRQAAFDRSSDSRLHAIDHAPGALPRVAYFSMEIALEAGLPTDSGGLGILAGDMLRSAADLAVPIVGVSLVYKHGYFTQSLGPNGEQREAIDAWDPRARTHLC